MAASATQAFATAEAFEVLSPVPDRIILRRKWEAALTPDRKLPAYEDVVLGSLGRLADYLAIVEGSAPKSFRVLRSGRQFNHSMNADVAAVPVLDLPGGFAGTICDIVERALDSSAPVSSQSHQVHDGMVATYEVLALPLAYRWGPPVVAIYVREDGTRFNLHGTLFRAMEEGMIALSAVRDGDSGTVNFRIIDCNAAAARLFGVSEEALRWRLLPEAGHGLITKQILGRFLDCHKDRQIRQFEIAVAVNGAERDLNVVITPIGELLSATLTDIRDLTQREVSFRLLFDSNPMPMLLYDPETLKIVRVNDATVAHYGHSRVQFDTMTLFDLWPSDEWESHGEIARTVKDVYRSERTWRHIKADGSQINVLAWARAVAFGERKAVLITVLDVTEQKRAEEPIAHNDALTDLSNRAVFQARLKEAMIHVLRYGESLAVHFMDLDNFKSVNDTLGHQAGDRLLRAVAERLKASLRNTDMVARLGGDEFSIVQWPISGPKEANALARKLIEVVGRPYEIDGQEIIIGASVGIALGPVDGDCADVLLRNADMALYRAKEHGGNDSRFFELEMDRQIQNRRALELDLRKALANGEFELLYQPLINLPNDEITGFEALLRWHHPTRGTIYPAEFIPIAEDIGLIAPISEWVLRTACVEANRWPETTKVAVNLSAVQFRTRGLVQMVVGTLAHSGLRPERLELEITESVLLSETQANLATLHQLRNVGVRISLDDFGTGYSSLSYLRSFPFDKLKIDRSFVRDLVDRPDCLVIIRAILGLGRNLGIAATVEGVETKEQLDLLRAEGCTEVQGYLFSTPQPINRVAELLQSRETTAPGSDAPANAAMEAAAKEFEQDPKRLIAVRRGSAF
jgi:diguanylate cyclase (GGDEF)-like protein/PAS domain S-box-containing protein